MSVALDADFVPRQLAFRTYYLESDRCVLNGSLVIGQLVCERIVGKQPIRLADPAGYSWSAGNPNTHMNRAAATVVKTSLNRGL